MASRKCRPCAVVDSGDSPFIRSGKSCCRSHDGQHGCKTRMHIAIAGGEMISFWADGRRGLCDDRQVGSCRAAGCSWTGIM